jgi:hypothetical protein
VHPDSCHSALTVLISTFMSCLIHLLNVYFVIRTIGLMFIFVIRTIGLDASVRVCEAAAHCFLQLDDGAIRCAYLRDSGPSSRLVALDALLTTSAALCVLPCCTRVFHPAEATTSCPLHLLLLLTFAQIGHQQQQQKLQPPPLQHRLQLLLPPLMAAAARGLRAEAGVSLVRQPTRDF